MKKVKVFVTGAAGNMGYETLKQLLTLKDIIDITTLDINTKKNKRLLMKHKHEDALNICWGNLLNYEDVYKCVKDADIVLHIAALVSPAADYKPELAMKNNYGSTRNIIRAIKDSGRENKTKLVYIGTVAETGDRMPPIHWGRVGDPIKPSMFDYYAVSKIASERLVIESGLKYWVSLRQTGIIGPAMSKIRDAIMFHNCLDNVLEYVSDRDSGIAMKHLCEYDAKGTLAEDFWCHIYNIGGGEKCRTDTYNMYRNVYKRIGLNNIHYFIKPKEQALRNFHGHYYLDSDKLDNYLHFRNDSMDYFYDSFCDNMGIGADITRFICKLPGGQRSVGFFIKMFFHKIAMTEHGTARFIKDNSKQHIEAYWGNKNAWDKIPEDLRDMEHYSEWDKVVYIDHGYDETKPESELDLEDVRGAALFRGGKCISDKMEKGNWKEKLRFKCAFDHEFEASPRLVLEGGHWCSECERKSWNYGQRAKVDPFFAQVWIPLHDENEIREYPKIVNELDA